MTSERSVPELSGVENMIGQLLDALAAWDFDALAEVLPAEVTTELVPGWMLAGAPALFERLRRLLVIMPQARLEFDAVGIVPVRDDVPAPGPGSAAMAARPAPEARVVIQWQLSGRFNAAAALRLPSLAADRQIHLDGCLILDLEDERPREVRLYVDRLKMASQVGLLPQRLGEPGSPAAQLAIRVANARSWLRTVPPVPMAFRRVPLIPGDDPVDVLRRLVAAIDAHDLRHLDTDLAPGFVTERIESALRVEGRTAARAQLRRLFASFPDLRLRAVHIAGEGALAVVEWRMTGTFAGAPLAGIRPSGRRLDIRGVDVVTLEGGGRHHGPRMLATTGYADSAAFLRTFGLLPASMPPPAGALLGALGDVALRRRSHV